MQPVFRDQPPSPALRDWVKAVQLVRLDFRDGGSPPPKAYWPRPACALAFYPRDPEFVTRPGADGQKKPRAVLIGQTTALEYRCGGSDFCVLQVEFQPGALHRLTGGLRASEFTDGFEDAEAVLGPEVGRTVARLTAEDDSDAMIALVEGLLLTLVARAAGGARTGVDWAADSICHGAAVSIAALAGRAGLSTRQLHRGFVDRMGVEPSVFGRIARFDRLMRARNTRPDWDWLSLALDAGYHDHRHMARDFHAFTGHSPSGFHQRELAAPERLFGHMET